MPERDAAGDRPWSDEPVRSGEPVPGRCEFCEWSAVAGSYPEMVKRYQDHLRESHPAAWLRG
jgi:hypothetical protein